MKVFLRCCVAHTSSALVLFILDELLLWTLVVLDDGVSNIVSLL